MAAQIVSLGHSFAPGAFSELVGGEPTRDHVWGIAKIGPSYVTFSGRRTAGNFTITEHGPRDLPALKRHFGNKLKPQSDGTHYLDKSGFVRQLLPNIESQLRIDRKKIRKAIKG